MCRRRGNASERRIKEKFLRDHRMLRGKAAVVAALALDVLRGDEDLVSALRLKGEELYAHLTEHMRWEERLLVPLLIDSARQSGAEIIEDHRKQRLRLDRSLVKLRRIDVSFEDLAEECLELVRWLEIDMTSEESRVLRSMVGE